MVILDTGDETSAKQDIILYDPVEQFWFLKPPAAADTVLTAALKDNLQQMVSRGVLLAEQIDISKRIDICMGCEFFVKNGERCNKCGCYMNIKARLQASKCPVGKW